MTTTRTYDHPNRLLGIFDGPGNVSGLVRGTDGSTAARYDYDPFGQTIRSSGELAETNKIGFSANHTEKESDFAYDGYRYDNPLTGKWPNRDPIGELGFQTIAGNRNRRLGDGNLYCFVENNPLTKFDLLGLSVEDVTAILNQFKKTMAELCKKKKRCDCPVGALKDLHASCSSVLGCAAQALLSQ
jgi:RHS repeat-associated protein